MKPNKNDIFDSMDIDRDWIHTEVLGDRKKGNILSILTFVLVLICAGALIFIAFKDMFGKDDLSNLENMDKVKQEQQAAADAQKAQQDAAAALANQQAQQQAATELVYTVKSGDTLAGIAEDLKVDMNKIAAANNLTTPYALEVGQQLKIPGVPATPAATTPPAAGTTAPVAGSENTYTVKAGDTLAQIGATLGIDYKTIAALNNLQAPYNLEVGQVLKTK
jgi:LysM repeat protein